MLLTKRNNYSFKNTIYSSPDVIKYHMVYILKLRTLSKIAINKVSKKKEKEKDIKQIVIVLANKGKAE